ncbi:MAG: gamma-glutamyltransferase, partial [Cyanobacteria bacterium P01_D01_bin.44]
LLLAIALDMAIGRSIYHPLVHIYRLTNWGLCQRSAITCNYDEPTQAPLGQAAVATSHHEATRVGIEILEQGGNAIDAATAIAYSLAVTHPCCGNLGGGGFMTIRLADGTTTFINFREVAPLAATPTLYQNESGEVIEGLSTEGYLAVALPGTVAGIEYARAKYGSGQLSRSELIEPARKLAAEGFILSESGAQLLKRHTKKFRQHPNVAEIFLNQGQPFRAGDRLVQTDLAQTLAQIAEGGEQAFYEGAIAQSIVDASTKNGGILSLDDFAAYQVEESSPLSCNYRGFTIITTPPPGGGPVLCQMLGTIEGFPIGDLDYHSGEHLHWLLASMLFAYRDRNFYLGDPNFVDVPLDRLLSEDYLISLQKQIPEYKALSPKNQFSAPDSEGENTTHFSVVDSAGNAVSVTYTINTFFGSGIIAGDTGFFLNNEMDDFTAKPGAVNSFGLKQGLANQIEPGKRPLSSMSPTIVLDKNQDLYLVTGSPGGPTIPTTVLQTISNLIDFKMTANEAVNQPRFHYQGAPNIVLVEPLGLSGSSYINLWERGYRVSPFLNWGAAMSIGGRTDSLQPIRDVRRLQGGAAACQESCVVD